MTSHHGVSVIIPTWNGRNLLKKHLPHVIQAMEASDLPFEIIIVDDASTDDTAEMLGKNFPEVKVLKKAENEGFGRTVNFGVNHSIYDKILMLNSDISPHLDFLDSLLPFFENENTFAAASRAVSAQGKALTKPHGYTFKWGRLVEVYTAPKEKPSYGFGASGGHALFDKDKFLELGGFCNLFSPFYYEDADLSYRAWKRGYFIWYQPQSVVTHEHSAVIGRLSRHYVSIVFARNRWLFVWKNISDMKYLMMHVVFTPFWLVVNSIRNPFSIIAFFWALSKIPTVIGLRNKERCYRRRSDQEILSLILESLK
jgi:GT2 family glycosyltransferase